MKQATVDDGRILATISLALLTLYMLLVPRPGFALDSTKIFFAGDNAVTYCRETSSGPDLYLKSFFNRLRTNPPPGFSIRPSQAIITQGPCSQNADDPSKDHPYENGYGYLKILDWNTECLDSSGNGVCSWDCDTCPDPADPHVECNINWSLDYYGEPASWCCCASRRACIDQSNATYVMIELAANDLLQLFYFYNRDVDEVVEEAKSLTSYLTTAGHTVIWLSAYPIGYGSLGKGETSCSDVLSCASALNSNAEYFYQRLASWLGTQPDVYFIDFFNYIKINDPDFIYVYGYGDLYKFLLKPSGHRIYYDYVSRRLATILKGNDDFDGDGINNSIDNCLYIPNSNQANSDTDAYGDACDNCWYQKNDEQDDSNGNCPSAPYSTDPDCGDACESVTTTSSTSLTTTSVTTTTVPTSTTSAPSCQTTQDCEDDGLFCNGDEVCDDGSCVHEGSPCNEGEACDEARNICYVPTEPCELSILPKTADVLSGQAITFTAASTGDCNNPSYEWSVQSKIGSRCDDNGHYRAGINSDRLSLQTDVVTVVDHANNDRADQATVTVIFGCPVMHIYGGATEEIEVLRRFRDNVLSTSREGQEIIRLYYQLSPAIVKAMAGDKQLREDLKNMLDSMVPVLKGQTE